MDRLIYSRQLGELANIVIIDGEIVKNKYVCELTQRDILKQIINHNNILVQEDNEIHIYCNVLIYGRVKDILGYRENNNIHVIYNSDVKECLPEAMVKNKQKINDETLEINKTIIMICEKSGILYKESVDLVCELIELGYSTDTIKDLFINCGVNSLYTFIEIDKMNQRNFSNLFLKQR